jgi:hypothetical protein
MGIEIHAATFLRSEVRRGVAPGRLLTLGHQAVYMDGEAYRSLVASLGVKCRDTIFADDIFRGLGAKSMDVMDASSYEGANVLHNLNEPIGRELVEKYDCVFDGGSLEHVFNFPVALKNCLEMVKVGGHFITITPANSQCGHGFYQFSPELFYSALCAANGFSVERLLFVYRGQWFSVKKPADVRERVELITDEPIQLFVCAKKLETKPVFASWPQQSDYTAYWDAQSPGTPQRENAGSFKERVLRSSLFFRNLQSYWRTYKRSRKCRPSNRAWFVPVNLE